MGLGISPRIGVNAGGLNELLSNMEGKLDLTKGLGRKIANLLRADALRQFQTAGDPAWAPLSPRTIARKRRLGYPRLNRRGLVPRSMIQNGNFGPENILMMKGDLLSSWTREDDPHHVETIESSIVEIGSDLIYAGTMQDGGTGFNGAPIPARPIRVTDRAKREIAALVESELTGD